MSDQDWPMIYDARTGDLRRCTQADVDKLVRMCNPTPANQEAAHGMRLVNKEDNK